MTGDELRALYRHFIRDLENTRMNLQQLRVAKLIALLSFGCGEARARITKHADIGDAVWIHRKDVGEVIEELKTMQVVREPQDLVFELETDRAKWKPQWRWNTEAERAKGIATVRELVRFQKVEQGELLEPEPCFDAALMEVSRESALRETVNRGNALLPEVPTPAGAGSAPGSGHRENASSLPVPWPKAGMSKREEALALRAQIAQSLRSAGWSDKELQALEEVPADQLHRWVSHPPGGGQSPTEVVGGSPTNPRAGARASSSTIGTNANASQWIQSGDVAPRSTRRVDEGVMYRIRQIVGDANAGYWHETLLSDGLLGERAAFQAIGVWADKRNKDAREPSKYLMGIYRRMRRELSAATAGTPSQGVS